jgi:hypothetical protein
VAKSSFLMSVPLEEAADTMPAAVAAVFAGLVARREFGGRGSLVEVILHGRNDARRGLFEGKDVAVDLTRHREYLSIEPRFSLL